MQIEIFTFCGQADTENNINLFDIKFALACTALPAKHAPGFIFLRASFDEMDTEPHQVTLQIKDSDGRALNPPDTHTVNDNPHEAKIAYLNCKWSIGEFTFSRFGAYWIELLIDGSLSHRLPLVIQRGIVSR